MPEEPAIQRTGSEAVTLIMTFAIKPEFEEDFLDMTRHFVAQVESNEPGTQLFVVTKHPDRPSSYVLVERYRDESAFEAHRNSPYLDVIRPRLQQYFDGRPELLRLQQVIPS
jgi:quinol monooxygenase YgiN